MPPRGPAQSTTPPAAAAAPAASAQPPAAATPTPARQQAAYPVKRSALPPSVGGLTYAPEPEGGEFEKFADLDAGDYTFSAWVDSIIMWPDGAAVVWRCNAQVFGDGSMSKAGVYGRDIGWPQSPPPTMGPGTKGYPYWRRRLVTCYRDLGLREEADPANNFPGWEADANGSLVPPFYSFFTDTIGRAVVPIMFRIKVHVDAGYEGIPKVEGLAYEQVGDSYVLAPTPRKLPDWVAGMHGWIGEADNIVIKRSGVSIPILKNISGINPPADMPTHRTL